MLTVCPSEERVVNDSISCDLPTNSDNGPSDINNTDRTHEDTNSPEGNRTNEDTNSPEGNNDPTTPVRRSTRNVSLPKKLNDFVIEGKVSFLLMGISLAGLGFLYGCWMSSMSRQKSCRCLVSELALVSPHLLAVLPFKQALISWFPPLVWMLVDI
ncbi:hypothetical protein HanLR1_Chr04g0156551 [Helianthus annuus]|nr:hypothetical protein HanLR1_Chr04g0156551 [Helianthus annuus]